MQRVAKKRNVALASDALANSAIDIMPLTGLYWRTNTGKDSFGLVELTIARPSHRRSLHHYSTLPNEAGLPLYLLQVLHALKQGIDTPQSFSSLYNLPIRTAREYYSQLAHRGLIVRTVRRNSVRYALAQDAVLSAHS